jgi:hypothetical protein
MTGNRKTLGEEVGDVAQAADEHDTKVFLADLVPDPMPTPGKLSDRRDVLPRIPTDVGDALAMVERVGEACSDASAQVGGRILPSTHLP